MAEHHLDVDAELIHVHQARFERVAGRPWMALALRRRTAQVVVHQLVVGGFGRAIPLDEVAYFVHEDVSVEIDDRRTAAAAANDAGHLGL